MITLMIRIVVQLTLFAYFVDAYFSVCLRSLFLLLFIILARLLDINIQNWKIKLYILRISKTCIKQRKCIEACIGEKGEVILAVFPRG